MRLSPARFCSSDRPNLPPSLHYRSFSSIHRPMSPTEPVCLITGASAGIGAALAREFVQHGYALVLTARREAKLQALADEIAAAGHTRPTVIAADLSTTAGITTLTEAMTAQALAPAF